MGQCFLAWLFEKVHLFKSMYNLCVVGSIYWRNGKFKSLFRWHFNGIGRGNGRKSQLTITKADGNCLIRRRNFISNFKILNEIFRNYIYFALLNESYLKGLQISIKLDPYGNYSTVMGYIWYQRPNIKSMSFFLQNMKFSECKFMLILTVIRHRIRVFWQYYQILRVANIQ